MVRFAIKSPDPARSRLTARANSHKTQTENANTERMRNVIVQKMQTLIFWRGEKFPRGTNLTVCREIAARNLTGNVVGHDAHACDFQTRAHCVGQPVKVLIDVLYPKNQSGAIFRVAQTSRRSNRSSIAAHSNTGRRNNSAYMDLIHGCKLNDDDVRPTRLCGCAEPDGPR